jgi:hypothetical protein
VPWAVVWQEGADYDTLDKRIIMLEMRITAAAGK